MFDDQGTRRLFSEGKSVESSDEVDRHQNREDLLMIVATAFGPCVGTDIRCGSSAERLEDGAPADLYAISQKLRAINRVKGYYPPQDLDRDNHPCLLPNLSLLKAETYGHCNSSCTKQRCVESHV